MNNLTRKTHQPTAVQRRRNKKQPSIKRAIKPGNKPTFFSGDQHNLYLGRVEGALSPSTEGEVKHLSVK